MRKSATAHSPSGRDRARENRRIDTDAAVSDQPAGVSAFFI
jgi:hypothetical protein